MGDRTILKQDGLQHLRATVLWAILPEVLFFSAVATAVCLISEYVRLLDIATTLLTAFGAVIGFLISFRTSSAFASYTEGRKYWSSIILASRSFARLTWLHVPSYIDPPKDPKAPIPLEEVRRALIEKKSAINLIAAFSIATQHYCRSEAGIYYEDLYPLVCYLPRYRLPTSNYIARPDLDPVYTSDPSPIEALSAAAFASISASGSTIQASSPLLSRSASLVSGVSSFTCPYGTHARKATWSTTEEVFDPKTGGSVNKIKCPHPLLPARNPPPRSLDRYIPFYALFADIGNLCLGRARKIRDKAHGKQKKRRPIAGQKGGDNVPLEITLLLSGWVAALQRRKSIDVPTINSLLAALQSFSDSLTGLERVLLSPIPVAYSLHLRHVIWLYLLLLPSQLYATFNWLTVPATAITTFCFLGFLQIGNEIENPLGYDASDLDLESFTQIIVKELRELCAHPQADPADFFFADANLPFATGPDWAGKSARQIIEECTPIAELEESLKAGGGQPTVGETQERQERHSYRRKQAV